MCVSHYMSRFDVFIQLQFLHYLTWVASFPPLLKLILNKYSTCICCIANISLLKAFFFLFCVLFWHVAAYMSTLLPLLISRIVWNHRQDCASCYPQCKWNHTKQNSSVLLLEVKNSTGILWRRKSGFYMYKSELKDFKGIWLIWGVCGICSVHICSTWV